MRSLFVGLTLIVVAITAPMMAAQRVELSTDASKTGAKTDRNIFGQFAEHLGHGIYEGIRVGPITSSKCMCGSRMPRSYRVTLDAGWYTHGDVALPRVDAIAAKDTKGKLWLDFTNPDPNRPVEIEASLAGITTKAATGETLTAPKVCRHLRLS